MTRMMTSVRVAVILSIAMLMVVAGASASHAAVDLTGISIRNNGWRYNLTIMREQAKTDAFKAKQYQYYLTKNKVTDEFVVAYAAAVAAKTNAGTPPAAPPVVTPVPNAPPPSNPLPVDPTPVVQPVPDPVVPPAPDPVDPPVDPPTNASWKIYKGFRYNNTPSLANCGISEDIRILYEDTLFGSGSMAVPNVAHLKANVVPDLIRRNVSYVVIDIEHWDQLTEMDKYISVIRTLKQGVRAAGNTRMKFGFYMMVPIRNYLAPNTRASRPGRWVTWLAQNEQLRRLAAEVDVVFPSLYTFEDNQAKWLLYAEANIAEARKYNKPTIAFVWPQYHNSNKTIGATFIQKSFWQFQLDTLNRIADSVVIWGSVASRTSHGWLNWNKTADWWTTTKAYGAKKTNVPLNSACLS